MSPQISAPTLMITPEAVARLREEADFSRSLLCVRHLVGCGGTGFRLSIEENPLDEAHRFSVDGIPVAMDDLAYSNLRGAILEVDPDPAGKGFRLVHPNAVLTTFC